MAISHGMTSAIMSPLHPEVKTAIQAADVLAGADTDCATWIRHHRDPDAPCGARERRGNRRRRPV
jgi:5-methyltetrahydrofolate--homocysteine methyltransferase